MSALDDYNYFNDFRVVARDQKPWFIEHNGENMVAIKIPTDDYFALENAGYDPDEFPARPTINGAWVPTLEDCHRCKGHGELYRHKEWQGVTFTLDGEPCYSYNWDHHWKDGIEAFDRIKCYDGRCFHGKHTNYWSFPDGDRPDPDLEDRVYIPYRTVCFPMVLVDCRTCRGTGRHVNPSIDAGGLTQSDFDEDPGFREDYFSGVYDVTCYECNGAKKMPRIDTENMCPEDLELYKKWRDWMDEKAREEAEWRAERAAEIRMGC